jgi:hypothetical protein
MLAGTLIKRVPTPIKLANESFVAEAKFIFYNDYNNKLRFLKKERHFKFLF